MLIHAKDLIARLGKSGSSGTRTPIRLFDCSGSLKWQKSSETFQFYDEQSGFEAGHLPGAEYVNIDSELSRASSSLLFENPSAEEFSRFISTRKLSEKEDVVLYSKTSVSWATRVWWLLISRQWKGRVYVLNGGYNSWVEAGGDVEKGKAKDVKGASATKEIVKPVGGYAHYADLSDVVKGLEKKSSILVSSVHPRVFAGNAEEFLGAKGHIPSSLNLFYEDLLQDDGTFLAKDKLFDIFERYHLFDIDTKKILYCGAGIGASVLGFTMAYLIEEFPLAQVPDFSLYDGSMQEWGSLRPEEVEVGAVKTVDVSIIGGGPAGLSAAMTLGRSARKVVVFDDGHQRNRVATAAHNIIVLDGTPPMEIIQTARKQLFSTYGEFVEFLDEKVSSLQSVNGLFKMKTSAKDFGTIVSSMVVFATGVVDKLPDDIKGIHELWGDLVAHCPYCHGFEVLGGEVGLLLSESMMVLLHTLLLRNVSTDLTVFTHGNDSLLPAKTESLLSGLGVKVVKAKISALSKASGGGKDKLVGTLTDGNEVSLDALFVAPKPLQQCSLAEGVGCEIDDTGMVKVDAFQQTTVQGCYAAGDTSNLHGAVTLSMAQGMKSGATVNAALLQHRMKLFES